MDSTHTPPNALCGPQWITHPDYSTASVRENLGKHEVPIANLISDGIVTRCRWHDIDVDFSFIDTQKIRTGLPLNQQITRAIWSQVLPPSLPINVLTLTGATLYDLLQTNSKLHSSPKAAQTFLYFSRAVRYIIEHSHIQMLTRASYITVNGIPLDLQLDRRFRVAMPGQIGLMQQVETVEAPISTPLDLQTEILTYVSGKKVIYGRDGRLHIGLPEDRPEKVAAVPYLKPI